jgi:hypothetical protein
VKVQAIGCKSVYGSQERRQATSNQIVQRNHWNGASTIDICFADFGGFNPTQEFEKFGDGNGTVNDLSIDTFGGLP